MLALMFKHVLYTYYLGSEKAAYLFTRSTTIAVSCIVRLSRLNRTNSTRINQQILEAFQATPNLRLAIVSVCFTLRRTSRDKGAKRGTRRRHTNDSVELNQLIIVLIDLQN